MEISVTAKTGSMIYYRYNIYTMGAFVHAEAFERWEATDASAS